MLVVFPLRVNQKCAKERSAIASVFMFELRGIETWANGSAGYVSCECNKIPIDFLLVSIKVINVRAHLQLDGASNFEIHLACLRHTNRRLISMEILAGCNSNLMDF